MIETVSPEDLLSKYALVGRSLCGLALTAQTATIVVDLFHVDDPQRNDDAREYNLSISVDRAKFRLAEGDLTLLQDEFSGDILRADVQDNVLRILADCRFYSRKINGVVLIELLGPSVSVDESATG